MARPSKGRKAVQLRTGAPLSYGATRRVLRPQERVLRSQRRPLMSTRRVDMTAFRNQLDSIFRTKRVRTSLLQNRFSLLQVPRQRVLRTTPRTRNVLLGLSVRYPKKVRFCAQRLIRRGVLFAFKSVGFRGSSPGRRRTYRRNANSMHGC